MSIIDKPKETVKKQITFWTAGSKKVSLAIGFLISVIIDSIWLKDAIYGQDLFKSKVFWAIVVSVGVIITSDIKTLFNKALENKLLK